MFSKRKKILYLLTVLGFICLFFFAPPASAQQMNQGLANFGNVAGYGERPLIETVATIIKIFISFLGLIALIIVIYGGFLWMTSKGEPEKLTKAKKILINGLIGLAIIVFSYAIASFILGKLIQISGPGGPGGGEEPPGGYPDGKTYLVITDKYPKEDETVPRNTSVIVSFNQILDCDSVVLCTGNNQPEGCTVSIIKDGGDYISGILKVNGSSFIFKPDGECTNTPLEALSCQPSENCVPPPPPCGNCVPCPVGTKNNPVCEEMPEHEPPYQSLACCGQGDFCCNCFPDKDISYSIEILDGENGVKGAGANGKTIKQTQIWDFTVENIIDTTAPVVLSNLPQGNAVPINTGIAVVFSKPIDTTTLTTYPVTEPTVQIKANGEPVAGYFEKITSKAFIFRPNSSCEAPYEHCKCFPKLTEISVVLRHDPPPGPGIRDANCNLLDCTNERCEWNFTTSNSLDLTPPEVKFEPQQYGVPYGQKEGEAKIEPYKDETGVERDRTIVVELYDEDNDGNPTDMDPTSVNYDTFQLLNVVAKYIETGTSPIFELQPYSVLEAYKTYQAVVYGGGQAGGSCGMDPELLWGVRDLAGNAMIENFLWPFTTGGQVNNGDPYITKITPRDGPPGECVTVEGYNLGCCQNWPCEDIIEAQNSRWSAVSGTCQTMSILGKTEFYSSGEMIPAEVLRWDEISRPEGELPPDYSPFNQIIVTVPKTAETGPLGVKEIRVTPAHD